MAYVVQTALTVVTKIVPNDLSNIQALNAYLDSIGQNIDHNAQIDFAQLVTTFFEVGHFATEESVSRAAGIREQL